MLMVWFVGVHQRWCKRIRIGMHGRGLEERADWYEGIWCWDWGNANLWWKYWSKVQHYLPGSEPLHSFIAFHRHMLIRFLVWILLCHFHGRGWQQNLFLRHYVLWPMPLASGGWMYNVAEHCVHNYSLHTTTNRSQMVIQSSGVGRNADLLEGLLCNYSKCLLHERNGLVSGDDVNFLCLHVDDIARFCNPNMLCTPLYSFRWLIITKNGVLFRAYTTGIKAPGENSPVGANGSDGLRGRAIARSQQNETCI